MVGANCHDRLNETDAIDLQAPGQVGEHRWIIRFPRHEIAGIVHEEASVVVPVAIRPHATSAAVWDVPSPVLVLASFTAKVGVRCEVACPLAGRLVEVRDEGGARIGQGRLGEAPWPGTVALYVAEVRLTAPAAEGMRSWSAVCLAPESGLPHAEASAMFTFRVARPPDHRVTVCVTEKETKRPLEDVDVRMGVYRASTDAEGLARLAVARGVYALDAWKPGYETTPRSVEVAADLVVDVEVTCVPETDPDEGRTWM
jgi:hypothetical protein